MVISWRYQEEVCQSLMSEILANIFQISHLLQRFPCHTSWTIDVIWLQVLKCILKGNRQNMIICLSMVVPWTRCKVHPQQQDSMLQDCVLNSRLANQYICPCIWALLLLLQEHQRNSLIWQYLGNYLLANYLNPCHLLGASPVVWGWDILSHHTQERTCINEIPAKTPQNLFKVTVVSVLAKPKHDKNECSHILGQYQSQRTRPSPSWWMAATACHYSQLYQLSTLDEHKYKIIC